MTTAMSAGRAARRGMLAVALLLPVWLGACDSSPKTQTVQTQDTSNAPYPNLATVPDKPPPVSPEEIRQRTAEGLAADRTNAEYTSSLTAQGTAQPAASPPAAAPPPSTPKTGGSATAPVPTPSAPPPAGVPPAPAPQAAPPAPATVVPSQAPMTTPTPAPVPTPAAPPPANGAPQAPLSAGTPGGSSGPTAPTGGTTTGGTTGGSSDACAKAEPWEKDLYCNGGNQPPQTATAPSVPPAPPPAAAPPPAPGTAQPTPTPVPNSPVPPPQGQVGGGRVQMVGVIFFANGSAKMDARDTAVLGEIAKLYRQYGGIIRVIGYASNSGSGKSESVSNLTLSLDRALGIGQVLISNGVPATAVVTEARAGGGAVAQPYIPPGEAGERRAEIYLEY